MPRADIHRIVDYERRSREPDAQGPREPGEEAVVIVLPVIRVERFTPKPATGGKPR